MSRTPQVPPKSEVKDNDRHASVDSERFFEDDGFGDYDFTPNSGKGPGESGGGGGSCQKKSSGKGVYSAKHVRAKEAVRQNQNTSHKKKGSPS